MAYRYDYKAIKERFPIERAMVMFKIKGMAQEGFAWRGVCPACGGNRSFTIDPAKNVFHCKVADIGGSVIDLVSHLADDCSLHDACKLITEYEKSVEKEPEPTPARAGNGEGFAPLAHLSHQHEAVQDMGVPVDVAQAIGIGYASRGLMKGFVAIPLRDERGVLTGYLGVPSGTEVKAPTTWWGISDKKVVPIKRRA